MMKIVLKYNENVKSYNNNWFSKFDLPLYEIETIFRLRNLWTNSVANCITQSNEH